MVMEAQARFEGSYVRPDVAKAEEHLRTKRAEMKQGLDKGQTSRMVMDKFEDWIKMTVASLKNQLPDPDHMMDPHEMAGQFAQFSQVLGLVEVRDEIKNMAVGQNMAMLMQAAEQTNKLVEVKSSSFFHDPNKPTELVYNLPADAARATMIITDTNNVPITQFAVDGSSGRHALTWDGLDRLGRPLPSGEYKFRVSLFDDKGRLLHDVKSKTPIEAATSIRGVVLGGRMDGSRPVLDVGGMGVPLESLVSIQNDAQKTANSAKSVGARVIHPLTETLRQEGSTPTLTEEIIDQMANYM